VTTLAELFVFIKGDDKHLEDSLDGAKQKTTSAGADIAKVLGGVIVGGATLAAGAIFAIGTKAFDVATSIDSATDQIGASLGLTADEAAKFGDVIKTVYGDNWGDSIEDVGAAVENVAKQLGLAASDPALPKMTANAFRLRDVFKVEVNESVNAAKTLMTNFGISGDKAFNMIAKGYQAGLDSSGDFLDTIGEYSVQFAEGGASAEEFFSALDTGLQGGMLGTDKAADAFKEFRVRIQDGSKLTADSLEMIGLNAEDITTKLANGSITVKDAWDLVQRSLSATTDTAKQFQAGVGLIGTQFEDLGAKVILGMDLTNDWAEGGIADISEMDTKYTSLGGVIEGMWRKFEVGIAPAGEAMLGFVNENLPAIQGVIGTVSGKVATFIGMIPLALMGIKKGWDEDWAGMRTTVTEFSTDMPVALAKMWLAIDTMFQTEGESTGDGWERFVEGLSTTTSSWLRVVIDSWTEAILSITALWGAWSAAFRGDWEGFWSGLAQFYEHTFNQILNWIEFVFGPELRNNIVGALNWAWDGMKEIWESISGWWGETFGKLFGAISPFTPSEGGISPENLQAPWEKIPIVAPGSQQSLQGSLSNMTNSKSITIEGGINISGVANSPEGMAYMEEVLLGILERATE
jgi:hypothetical protein